MQYGMHTGRTIQPKGVQLNHKTELSDPERDHSLTLFLLSASRACLVTLKAQIDALKEY